MEEETGQKQQQKSSALKKFAGPAIALLIAAGGGYWLVSSDTIDLGNLGSSVELVAKVNGEGLEKRLYDARFEQTKDNYEAQGLALEDADTEQLKQQVLDDMVDERLLVQYGKKQGITAEDAAVEQEYQLVVSQFESEEAFQDELALQNATLRDVREAIAQNIIVRQVADQQAAENNIEVSEEEIQQVYDEAAAGGAEVPEFEEARGEIENYVRQQKTGQLMQELVAKLREEASIEILS
jgi:peptidyl-prolyl cis-trans isomerase SurA